MKNFICLFVFLLGATAFAQPVAELTADGFTPVEFARPDLPNQRLFELSDVWAAEFNKEGYDIYDVTENSLKIDGFRKNAFFYRNLGESFFHNIKYTLTVSFLEKTCVVTFSVKEIYAKKTLLETTVAGYFTPEGTLKEGMDDVKPSLESTANKILKSYVSFIASN